MKKIIQLELEKNIIIMVIIFEGEYICNFRWEGKYTRFNKNNKLIFEGEYLKGHLNGKAKEYNNKGELIFEGEYLNGEKWNGKYIEYFHNQLCFKGNILNGKKKWKRKGIL